jgi:hypothetical protein
MDLVEVLGPWLTLLLFLNLKRTFEVKLGSYIGYAYMIFLFDT